MARLLAVLLLPLALALGFDRAVAQIYTPQLASGLSVSWEAGRAGASRVLIFGDVRNRASVPYERVVVLAEGLGGAGQVVSRGRADLPGVVPAKGTVAFELRLLSAGREKRFRVGVEAYQIAGATRSESP